MGSSAEDVWEIVKQSAGGARMQATRTVNQHAGRRAAWQSAIGACREQWCEAMRSLERSDLERPLGDPELKDESLTQEPCTSAQLLDRMRAESLTLLGALVTVGQRSYGPLVDLLEIHDIVGHDPLAGTSAAGEPVSLMQMVLLRQAGFGTVERLQQQLRLDGAVLGAVARRCIEPWLGHGLECEEASTRLHGFTTGTPAMTLAYLATQGAVFDPEVWRGASDLLVNLCRYAENSKSYENAASFPSQRHIVLQGARALAQQGFVGAELEYNHSALHAAAHTADPDLIALFLEAGADPHVAGPDGASPAQIIQDYALTGNTAVRHEACQDVWRSFQAARAAREALVGLQNMARGPG